MYIIAFKDINETKNRKENKHFHGNIFDEV
jgi:hypothetical protein